MKTQPIFLLCRRFSLYQRCGSGCVVTGRVPDLQSGGCGFESQPGLLRTEVFSAFHPSGVGKWVPAAAGKAKAGMASTADERVGVQVKLWTRAMPVRFCGGDSLRRGTISSVCTVIFIFYLHPMKVSNRDRNVDKVRKLVVLMNFNTKRPFTDTNSTCRNADMW